MVNTKARVISPESHSKQVQSCPMARLQSHGGAFSMRLQLLVHPTMHPSKLHPSKLHPSKLHPSRLHPSRQHLSRQHLSRQHLSRLHPLVRLLVHHRLLQPQVHSACNQLVVMISNPFCFLFSCQLESWFWELLQHISSVHTYEVRPAYDFIEIGKWDIEIKDLQTENVTTETFDGVMVCTGHHAEKHMPYFEGEENFVGRRVHSLDYREFKGYEDKRVAVIGIGNSDRDIAVELAKVSKQVYLTARCGSWVTNRVGFYGLPVDYIFDRHFLYDIRHHIMPRNVFNFFAEGIFNRRFNHQLYGLKPDHRFDAQHIMVNDELPKRIISGGIVVKPNVRRITETGVEFEDGSFEDDINVVIYATGYSFGFPFIEHKALMVTKNQVNLYEYMFPPTVQPPTIAVIGCVQPFGAVMPISELQGRPAVKFFKGEHRLPSVDEMWKDIAQRKSTMADRYIESQRHTIQVDYVTFMEELAVLVGCKLKFCPQKVRLEMIDKIELSMFGIPVCVATTEDELYMHCSYRDDLEFINVFDCNNLREVKQVIQTVEHDLYPRRMVACDVAKCLYLLCYKGETLEFISVAKVTKDDDDQFHVSPWISDLPPKDKGKFIMSVAANGNLMLSRTDGSDEVIRIYDMEGNLQQEIRLPLDLFYVSRIIPKSNGNLLFVSLSYDFKKQITETDKDGKIVKQFQSALVPRDAEYADSDGKLYQARVWCGDFDHSDGLVLRRRTVLQDNPSPRKKAKRSPKTPGVPNPKNGNGGGGGGGAPDKSNDGGAAPQL